MSGIPKYKASRPENKVCTRCKTEKPKEVFYTQKGLRRSYCPTCCSEVSKFNGMLRKLGVTKEQYIAMFQEQNGLCACCGQPELYAGNNGQRTKLLALDHDHQTSKVRQLLCHRCNIVIGLIQENLNLCDNLKDYIMRHHIDVEEKNYARDL